jgi:hypothetical protein
MFFASCKDEEEVTKSAACDILTFKVGEAVWDIGENEITRVYPSAILPTPLTPTLTVSPGATVNPISGLEQTNFFKEGGVEYIVTAEDRKTTKIYIARAIRTPYSGCEITKFTAGGRVWDINDTLITCTFPSNTQEASYVPIIEMSSGAKIRPLASEAKNFFTASGIRYTVTAEDGKSAKTYTVKAKRTSADCSIVSFIVNDLYWNITGSAVTHVFIPGIADATFAPTIILPQGATISPPSGEPQNFFAEEGVTYTVTAEDTTKIRTYTVKARNAYSGCNILSFATGGVKWTINGSNITRTYPAETIAEPLIPDIVLSDGATVYPTSGEAKDFFTESGVTYTVTAEDGIATKTYTAKANIETAIKFDRHDWTVLPRHGSHDWGSDGSGGQDVWTGGHPMLILDDDPASGWHSIATHHVSFPQVLIVDMKESKQVSRIVGNGDYWRTVQLYLTDDLSMPDYETNWINWGDSEWREHFYNDWIERMNAFIPAELPASSWGSPIAEGNVEGTDGAGAFDFILPQALEGQYLIIMFPENNQEGANTYVSMKNLEVYGY